jgi:uncharacterized protein DUF6851/vanadium-dependent haloperoxidase-like protein
VTRIPIAAIVLAAGVAWASPSGVAPAGHPIEHRAANPQASAAYRWVDVLLEATGREVDRVGARPTIISRQMAIALTSMYDAWAAYDDKAAGTRLGAALRRPAAERTTANKETAIAHAMFAALIDLFPQDREWISGEMRRMGQDPGARSADPASAVSIGRAAAAAVIEYRRHDGANQNGDETGSNGAPYSDYTSYSPRNTVDTVVDPDRWQPIPFSDGRGGRIAPGFLTPHWYKVTPFALEASAQFRQPPVPKVGSRELEAEVEESIRLTANLTLEQKALVEFMRDGPRSTGQSGHWLQFAQDVSRRDRYGLDQDVKLFFTIANTAFDAFIAAWDTKRFYDSSRPWTLIRHYRAGKTIKGYLGPCRGVGDIPAEQWHPYSPDTFVTPPFPGYPSGHSAVSGASSKMLELFTGSDRFEAFARHVAGSYTEAGCTPPAAEVILQLPTFTATAEMAGLSRILGGYHIQSDNRAGLAMGRALAVYSWPKYQAYFNGRAVTRSIPSSPAAETRRRRSSPE